MTNNILDAGSATRKEINRKNSSKLRQQRMKQNGGYHSKAQWEKLKQKYNYQCLICGLFEPDIKLCADHVIPIAKGGKDGIRNIQPLCHRCNMMKLVKRTDYRKPYQSRGLTGRLKNRVIFLDWASLDPQKTFIKKGLNQVYVNALKSKRHSRHTPHSDWSFSGLSPKAERVSR